MKTCNGCLHSYETWDARDVSITYSTRVPFPGNFDLSVKCPYCPRVEILSWLPTSGWYHKFKSMVSDNSNYNVELSVFVDRQTALNPNAFQ